MSENEYIKICSELHDCLEFFNNSKDSDVLKQIISNAQLIINEYATFMTGDEEKDEVISAICAYSVMINKHYEKMNSHNSTEAEKRIETALLAASCKGAQKATLKIKEFGITK